MLTCKDMALVFVFLKDELSQNEYCLLIILFQTCLALFLLWDLEENLIQYHSILLKAPVYFLSLGSLEPHDGESTMTQFSFLDEPSL